MSQASRTLAGVGGAVYGGEGCDDADPDAALVGWSDRLLACWRCGYHGPIGHGGQTPQDAVDKLRGLVDESGQHLDQVGGDVPVWLQCQAPFQFRDQDVLPGNSAGSASLAIKR